MKVSPFWRLPPALRPRRMVRPTREGWWCLLVAAGLGFTALNSGNNLLYLLESMLLALVIVSGVLSELDMRRLRLAPVLPEEIYAGGPIVLGARVQNAKRRLASRSIRLEVAGGPVLPLPHLPAGAERVRVEESVLDYLMALVAATRTSTLLTLGVSPRGSRSLLRAAQAGALADGRRYVVPDDVKRLAVPVLAHRVVPRSGAVDGDAAIRIIAQEVPVPR